MKKETSLHSRIRSLRKFSKTVERNFAFRENQGSIFLDIANGINIRRHEVGVVVPTGVGKTLFAALLMKAFGMPKTLFLTDRVYLLSQVADEFRTHIGIEDIGFYYGQEKSLDENLIVGSYSSLATMAAQHQLEKKKTKLDFDLVIVDEAHRALTEKRAKIFESLFKKDTIQIWLTATDKYNEDKKVENFVPIVKRMSIVEAIQLRLLAGMRTWIAQTDVFVGDVKVVGGELELEGAERVLDVKRRNMAAVAIYKKHFSKPIHHSAIFTCIKCTHADHVAELLRANGVKAQAIHSKLDEDVQAAILADFKSGKLSAIATVDMVNIGFNAPIASVLINLRSTASQVLATQRGGRIARLYDNELSEHKVVKYMQKMAGAKIATVVEFTDDYGLSNYRPILFSDILGSAEIFNHTETGQMKKGRLPSDVFWPTGKENIVEGVRLITSALEVAKITHDYASFRNVLVDKNGIAIE